MAPSLECPQCSFTFTPSGAGPLRCPSCNFAGAASASAGRTRTVAVGYGGATGAYQPVPTMAVAHPTAPAYASGPVIQRTSGSAITSFVLGVATYVVGWFGFALGPLALVMFLLPVLAIVFGAVGIKQTKDPTVGGKGLAVAGLVLGIVAVAIGLLVALLVMLVFAMFVAAFG
jgi:hypothetical protein